MPGKIAKTWPCQPNLGAAFLPESGRLLGATVGWNGEGEKDVLRWAEDFQRQMFGHNGGVGKFNAGGDKRQMA